MNSLSPDQLDPRDYSESAVQQARGPIFGQQQLADGERDRRGRVVFYVSGSQFAWELAQTGKVGRARQNRSLRIETRASDKVVQLKHCSILVLRGNLAETGILKLVDQGRISVCVEAR